MQACGGCKGIIDPASSDPHYCSSCITQGVYSLLCPYCGEHYRLQDGAINMCGKCLMKHMQGTKPPDYKPAANRKGMDIYHYAIKPKKKETPHDKNYTTIETTVYFECGYCGQPLEADTHHDHGRITISPCKHCLEQARGELLKKLLSYENKDFTESTTS